MDTYPKSRARHPIIWFAAIILLATGCVAYSEESPDWANSLTSDKGPGNFTAAPSMRLAYRFGWSGLRAAKADIHLYSPSRSTFETRRLWRELPDSRAPYSNSTSFITRLKTS